MEAGGDAAFVAPRRPYRKRRPGGVYRQSDGTMSKLPDIGTGAFANLVMEQAWADIEPVLTDVIGAYIGDRLTGYVKPWKALS